MNVKTKTPSNSASFGKFIPAAAARGISKSVAYELVNAGLLKIFRIGRANYIELSELDALPKRLEDPTAQARLMAEKGSGQMPLKEPRRQPDAVANPDRGLPMMREILGMTLRDYFAAKAMHALMTGEFPKAKDCIAYAKGAYEVADAMLKARAS